MGWSASEIFAACALFMLPGNVVDPACIHGAPPNMHSKPEGHHHYLTADGYWATAKDVEGAKAARRRKLKVLRPGRPSKDDKAAAALLCDISATSSQMPAAVGTSDEITTTTSTTSTTTTTTSKRQSKRLRGQPAEFLGCAGGSASCPLGSTAPAAQGTSDEITTKRQSKRSRGQPAETLSCAGGSASSSLGPAAPAMPKPAAQGSKRARQLPAHLADYVC